VPCFTYLLRCADGSLYCGYTTDLDARVATHNSGKGAAYTRSRRPVVLAWSESHPTLSEALRREAEIKRWPRAKKEALVAGDGVSSA
jgi:predicted GIY-YIG superfamily endonuclease